MLLKIGRSERRTGSKTKSQISKSIEALETRALMTTLPQTPFKFYTTSPVPVQTKMHGGPYQRPFIPAQGSPAMIQSRDNAGKVVQGQDRSGNQYVITVHGPGQVVVTDVTPNDGVLMDDIDTIQIVGGNINSTYVTGQVSSSSRVLTNGMVQFQHLISQNGVNSIILNGFALAQTMPSVTPPPALTVPDINVYLPNGVRTLQIADVNAYNNEAGNYDPFEIVVGDPSAPLKFAPIIRVGTIYNTNYDSTTASVPATPADDPSVIFQIYGNTGALTTNAITRDTPVAGLESKYPPTGAQGLTTIATSSIGQFQSMGGGSLLALSSSSVWTGYTSLTDNWSSNTGIRVYTNADQTLDMTGPVNQNSVTVTKTAGLSGITSVGNPYPAPVKLLATNIPGGVSSIYYWNPNTNGGVGSWTTKTGTKIQNLIIPMCGSFIAVSAPSATTSWTFAESDKQKSSVITNYFRPSDENDNSIGLTLNINKGANFLDELSVYFDDKSSSVNEFSTDGIKMANPGLDFYTKSADNIELAVDSRKYINGSIIPVGINKAQVGKYSINVAEWTVPSTTPVYLVDAYTNKTVSLSSNSIYSFNIDNNPNSQGNKRFYLQLGKQVNVEDLLSVNIAPNPATDFITLSVNGNLDGNASVKVISMTGTVMINTTMESIAHSQLSIPVNQLSAGVYIVDVTVNGNRMTKQFVKQ